MTAAKNCYQMLSMLEPEKKGKKPRKSSKSLENRQRLLKARKADK
jgi:hypothetical protein